MYLADWGNGAGAAAEDCMAGADDDADDEVDEPPEQADRAPRAKIARTPMISVRMTFLMGPASTDAHVVT
jgi:hypothetical protein